MDNVIQNIRIEDIVPTNHQNNITDLKIIEDLAISIKNNGIKEPLILKKVKDRYEIISGIKRYKAAILVGLSTIPAIIKNDNSLKYIDDYEDYSNSIKNNSDIVNLSELNKEYERDDYNMNNEFMNNNNTFGIQPENPSNTPAFGGRFFPSLEDEPTNMGFNTNIAPTMEINTPPTNNFIDLTDLGTTPQSQPMPNLNQEMVAPMGIQPETTVNNNSVPQMDSNVINLANLTQNNSAVEPMPQPIQNNNFGELATDFQNPTNPVMETPVMPMQDVMPTVDPMALNQNMGLPQQNVIDNQQVANLNPMEQSIPTMPMNEQVMNNQFDMSQNMIQNPKIMDNLNINEPIQTNVGINSIPTMDNTFATPSMTPVMDNQFVEQPVINQPEMPNQFPQKDVLPVINTLKAVGVNLENFGYTIRITDEDLPNSYKITIEVDK